ncbi:MAG: response regulator transcription factor [Dehalococcoidia bacterium]|nr:response regulator transcription factor [Dehalococcoidia bacterium]
MKFLVIDDDPDIAEALSISLNLSWPRATVLAAPDGATGLWMAEFERPDAVILDIGLADIDGYEVCKRLRQFFKMALIMLTARTGNTEAAKALELGADDFITKPFSHTVLLSRLRTVLRRYQSSPGKEAPDTYEYNGFSMDLKAREVRRHGRLVKLTPIEYSLLCQLVKNAGRVLSPRSLLTKVWGPEYDDVNYVKVHLHHLRRKLEDDSQFPKMIQTEPGKGYVFVEPRQPGSLNLSLPAMPPNSTGFNRGFDDAIVQY